MLCFTSHGLILLLPWLRFRCCFTRAARPGAVTCARAADRLRETLHHSLVSSVDFIVEAGKCDLLDCRAALQLDKCLARRDFRRGIDGISVDTTADRRKRHGPEALFLCNPKT